MADNVAITAGTGTTIATDDIAGVQVQRVKTTWGPDGTMNDADVATGKPLPTQIRSATGLIPIGEPTDAKSTATDATSASLISINKQISASVQTVATNSGSALPAGTAVIGKVGVDQTSDGTTNAVRLLAETTKIIGNVGLVPATSGGLSISRTLIPNNTTAIVVKASAGQLYKVRATNNGSTIAYIKIYNATSATAGSGTPVDTIMIPAATSGGAGVVDTTDIGVAYGTGITYVVTTGIADADTTAPAATTYIVTMFYK